MADAQASGACGRKIVWVQVPSPASFLKVGCVFEEQNAEVAELADAQASGACGSNTVRVQVPPSAFFCFFKRIAGMNKRVRPKGLGSFFVWWL